MHVHAYNLTVVLTTYSQGKPPLRDEFDRLIKHPTLRLRLI